MAAAKWQQANGAKKCETEGQKRSETDSSKSAKTSESLKAQKKSETSENRRKSAKTIGVLFIDRFLAIFQWACSSGVAI